LGTVARVIQPSGGGTRTCQNPSSKTDRRASGYKGLRKRPAYLSKTTRFWHCAGVHRGFRASALAHPGAGNILLLLGTTPPGCHCGDAGNWPDQSDLRATLVGRGQQGGNPTVQQSWGRGRQDPGCRSISERTAAPGPDRWPQTRRTEVKVCWSCETVLYVSAREDASPGQDMSSIMREMTYYGGS
jgi:hypothetical protein